MMSDIYNISVKKDLMVVMRDGVRLCTDIYRPDVMGSFPAIVFRTPYDRTRSQVIEISTSLSIHGYVIVTQDARGWFASEGNKNEKDETDDGYDTVEWVANLPCCNGKVGMWGYSWPAEAAIAAAEAQPPHLVCLFVGGEPSGRKKDLTIEIAGNPTGILETGRRFLWLLNQAAENRKYHKNGWKTGPTNREESSRIFYNIDRYKWMWFIPLIEIPDYVFSGLKWLWKRDVSVQPEIHGGDPHKFKVPICWIYGWYDRLHGDFYLFEETVKRGATEQARSNQKLIVGPWGHGLPWNYEIDSCDFNFGTEALIGSSWDVMGPWFDHWLKGVETKISKEPPVNIFVLGENKWRYENEWPLTRAIITDYYLHSNGKANTAYGDGILDNNFPNEEPTDIYEYDSRDPVMSIDLKVEQEAPFDLRINDHRKDILFYYSKEFVEDMEVTGQPNANFWASSSARDTDFMVRLSDIYPDGRVLWLSYGIVRASRLVEDRTIKYPRPIEPQKIYNYSFKMRTMSNLFKVGHRLRIDVTSSHFPKFDRNHNTGKIEYWKDSDLLTATNIIYHDSEHPFKISLPIIPRIF